LDGLPQLIFEYLVFGDVFRGAHGQLGQPRTLPNRRDVCPDPYLPTVLGDVALLDLIPLGATREKIIEHPLTGFPVGRVREIQNRQCGQFIGLVAEQTSKGCVSGKATALAVDDHHAER
jgi:hypothetical protein